MIPSKIKIESFAKRCHMGTLGGKGFKRALQKAGLPSVLEPPGLDSGDGLSPDGITVFLFSGGRSYAALAEAHQLKSIAVETMGVSGGSTDVILRAIGRRLVEAVGKPRDAEGPIGLTSRTPRVRLAQTPFMTSPTRLKQRVAIISKSGLQCVIAILFSLGKSDSRIVESDSCV